LASPTARSDLHRVLARELLRQAPHPRRLRRRRPPLVLQSPPRQPPPPPTRDPIPFAPASSSSGDILLLLLLSLSLSLQRLAVEKDPGLVKALIALGQISCSRGLLAEAAEYFECALSKTKEQEVGNLVLASFGAGFSHLNQGKKKEGIEHLKRIAQLKEPESPAYRACYYSGLVLLESTLFNEGQKSEAAKYLRMAAVYDPAVNVYMKQCEEE
ncbi:hypothetical protein Taro_016885, partial [Colocasia esculenta]|nr:hypothetical protein [Colocasia esculenta]